MITVLINFFLFLLKMDQIFLLYPIHFVELDYLIVLIYQLHFNLLMKILEKNFHKIIEARLLLLSVHHLLEVFQILTMLKSYFPNDSFQVYSHLFLFFYDTLLNPCFLHLNCSNYHHLHQIDHHQHHPNHILLKAH
jgi:hypothetical protein